MLEGLRRRSWPDLLLLGVTAALFVLPAVVLVWAERPAQYSFQMYSGYGALEASWTDSEGSRHDVALREHIANARGELAWETFLPEALCERLPSAVAVEVRRSVPGRDRRREVAC